jgi:hypothetical protein
VSDGNFCGISAGKPGPITLALRQLVRQDMMEGPGGIRTEVNPQISG